MKDILIEEYKNGMALTALYKKYSICPQNIRKILIENGVPIRNLSEAARKYEIDETFLDEINEEWKAYFLGWMFSDGNVYVGARRHTISIQVTEQDKNILEFFNDKIFNNQKKLIFCPGGIKKTPQKDYQCKPCIKFQIDSKRLVSSLISLGCKPAKSLTLKFPDKGIIPDSLMNHFLRGVFDGDGCAYFSIKSSSTITIFGSLPFCEGLQLFLSQHEIFGFVGKGNGCHKFSITNRAMMLRFFNYLYSNSTFKLERKFVKFKSIIVLFKTNNHKYKANNFKGVYTTPNGKSFSATLRVDGKDKFLGVFQKEEDAAKAYDLEVLKSRNFEEAFFKLNLPLTSYISKEQLPKIFSDNFPEYI